MGGTGKILGALSADAASVLAVGDRFALTVGPETVQALVRAIESDAVLVALADGSVLRLPAMLFAARRMAVQPLPPEGLSEADGFWWFVEDSARDVASWPEWKQRAAAAVVAPKRER